MTTGDDMQNLAARLAALAGSELSIADQVWIDAALFNGGLHDPEAVEARNKLCDVWAPEVTRESPDAPLMMSKRPGY